MSEFLTTNKKYLIILALGLIMLVIPMLPDNAKKDNCEQRFTEVMQSAKGVGKIELITGTDNDGQINGVVIVAQGADNVAVKKQISDAACAVFGVQPHKIQVFSYKEEAMVNEIK